MGPDDRWPQGPQPVCLIGCYEIETCQRYLSKLVFVSFINLNNAIYILQMRCRKKSREIFIFLFEEILIQSDPIISCMYKLLCKL